MKHLCKRHFGVFVAVIHGTNLNILETFSKVLELSFRGMAQILITKARI
jgi:hypothetical protein